MQEQQSAGLCLQDTQFNWFCDIKQQILYSVPHRVIALGKLSHDDDDYYYVLLLLLQLLLVSRSDNM